MEMSAPRTQPYHFGFCILTYLFLRIMSFYFYLCFLAFLTLSSKAAKARIQQASAWIDYIRTLVAISIKVRFPILVESPWHVNQYWDNLRTI